MPNDGTRGFARSQVWGLSVLLCICLGVSISSAIDRAWAVSVTFGVIGLLNAALLWAFRRQLQRSQRDALSKVIMVGVVIFILATLIVLTFVA